MTTMKIFTGPPGTGKTREAARAAVLELDGKLGADWEDRHRALVAANRIIWISFHPSYAYEDFVEGYRPVKTATGAVAYEVEKGVFLRACLSCRGGGPKFDYTVIFSVGMEVPFTTVERSMRVTHVDGGGIAVASDFERSDQLVPVQENYIPFWVIDRLHSADIKPEELSYSGQHRDKSNEVCKKLRLPPGWYSDAPKVRAVYEFLKPKLPPISGPPGVEVVLEKPTVLVIDEINRADLSKVFGELITIIDLDKRSGAKEERAVILQYSKEKFTVPAKLSIIGTMNTADKSISSLDYAMRRRFTFYDVPPEPTLCPSNYGGLNIANFINRLNARISILLGRDNAIGHSDYLPEKLDGVLSTIVPNISDPALRDTEARHRAVAYVIFQKTIPTLLDYFHNDAQMVASAFGQKMDEDGFLIGVDSSGLFPAGVGPEDDDERQSGGPNTKKWASHGDQAWDIPAFNALIRR